MLGPTGHEEIVAMAHAKTEAYRLEAELNSQLPKYSLRRRLALWLRSIAESLEPQTSFSKQLRRA